jgi:hypothetical protein
MLSTVPSDSSFTLSVDSDDEKCDFHLQPLKPAGPMIDVIEGCPASFVLPACDGTATEVSATIARQTARPPAMT